MRKLVTIRKVLDISPIEGADMIEVVTIDGWNVVIKKGVFKVGDDCLYFEVDSFLPAGNPAWQFLVDKESRTDQNGIVGHKLRSINLRGVVSQGLVLPVTQEIKKAAEQGIDDFSELLGVTKWEPVLPACLSGQASGLFPYYIRKPDQERAQNLLTDIFNKNKDSKYEVTLKLDGSSMTVFATDTESGVCSRNLQLKINEENSGNSFISVATKSKLLAVLEYMAQQGKHYAIQGELMGPGIQGNRENLPSHKMYIFDIQDIQEKRYLTAIERTSLYISMVELGVDKNLILHVPIIHNDVSLGDLGITDIKQLLEYAYGPSITNKVREGLVFKRMDGRFSFKAISNKFLIKTKD